MTSSPFPENTTEPLEPSPDFQNQVFARIRTYERKRTWIRNGFTGVLAAGCAFWLGQQIATRAQGFSPARTPRVASAEKGVQWLLENQQKDGSWNSSTGGGHERFKTGVTSLATLALLHSPASVPREQLQASLDYLQKEASVRNLFHEEGPEFYNTMLTLLTLQEANLLYPDPQLETSLRDVLTHLIRIQSPQGGWGYASQSAYGYGDAPTSNSAVTWWIVQLLERASDVPGQSRALVKANAWLSERFDSPTAPQYREEFHSINNGSPALFWMAQEFSRQSATQKITDPVQDAYADYLRSTVEQPEKWLATLRKSQQLNGSWPPQEDRWGKAGGQVYVTALRILSQVPQGV